MLILLSRLMYLLYVNVFMIQNIQQILPLTKAIRGPLRYGKGQDLNPLGSPFFAVQFYRRSKIVKYVCEDLKVLSERCSSLVLYRSVEGCCEKLQLQLTTLEYSYILSSDFIRKVLSLSTKIIQQE